MFTCGGARCDPVVETFAARLPVTVQWQGGIRIRPRPMGSGVVAVSVELLSWAAYFRLQRIGRHLTG